MSVVGDKYASFDRIFVQNQNRENPSCHGGGMGWRSGRTIRRGTPAAPAVSSGPERIAAGAERPAPARERGPCAI
jgi:hypothetical protein